MTPQTEKTLADAPSIYTNEQGQAWANGYNDALEALQSEASLKFKLGQLVLEKMVSGNGIPPDRCVIQASEIEELKGQ